MKKILGKRTEMEYTFKFSGKDDGYLRITMNGKAIPLKNPDKIEKDEYHGPLASSANHPEIRKNTAYFKFGLYRDNYDYGINVFRKSNEKEPNENLEQDISAIEQAKEDEKNGHPMTIYFKDYEVIESSNKKIVEHEHLDKKEMEFRKNIEKFLEDIIGKDVFGLGKIKDYHIFTE